MQEIIVKGFTLKIKYCDWKRAFVDCIYSFVFDGLEMQKIGRFSRKNKQRTYLKNDVWNYSLRVLLIIGCIFGLKGHMDISLRC